MKNPVKLVVTLLFILLSAPAESQAPPPDVLRVATREIKPFVFVDGARLTGFSIELWQEISRQMNVKSEFIVKPSVQDLLNSVQSREAALGIAAISITAEREKDLDLSQPMFDAGLQIVTRAQGTARQRLVAVIAGALSSTALPILGIVLLIIVLIAHLVWFFERRHQAGMINQRSYFPGIVEACWWAASTLATQADQMPRSALARFTAVIWMFTSVVFTAYFTASVTSALTLQLLHGDINGPEDLPQKRVASVEGTTSTEYLRQHAIGVTAFPRVEDALDALQRGEMDAVVYDAPVLLYYAAHEGKGKVQPAGAMFQKEYYGIVFPSEGRYRKRVNEALLHIKEAGTYDRLYQKWFGGNGL